ncbi:hypothetical protein [Desulfogranum japonicum]|uniref:hypothetical protein n=1 Tax=Desulfogranum japonicum TaxID=231447 RepID=UPI00041271CA|nr:hypothetical protein [Desulfogranum japonicum]
METQNGEPRVSKKLIPVIREAITTVQMVAYKVLVTDIAERKQELALQEQRQLAGAVINNLFGTEPSDPEVSIYHRQHRDMVEEELRQLATSLQVLCPYLTDALRMQTICDNQEGVHSIPSLLMAKTLGLLQEERALPMPSTFMLSVRSLAVHHGLVEPMQEDVSQPEG